MPLFRRTAYAKTFYVVDFTGQTPGAFGSLAAKLGNYLALSRASAATVQTSASTLDSTPGTDVACVFSDGTHLGLALRETRTNKVTSSRVLNGTGWNAGQGTLTTGYARTAPDGASTCNRYQTAAGQFGPYQLYPNIGDTVACNSLWVAATTGTGAYQLAGLYGLSAGQGACASGTANTTWRRVLLSFLWPHAQNPLISVCESRNTSALTGGVAATAHDNVIDLPQFEIGKFSTDAIVGGSSETTRMGERLWMPNASFALDSGTFHPYVSTFPLGSSSQYTANAYLFDAGGGTKAWYDYATNKLNVQVAGGAIWTPAAAIAFNGFDAVEWQLANVGSASLATTAKVRINGAVTDLGNSGAAQGAMSSTPATIDLLCSGTANQFSALVAKFAPYIKGQTAF